MAEEKKEQSNYEVNFRELKSRIGFSVVLTFFAIKIDVSDGVEVRGACPLPGCSGKRSFTVNFQKQLFNCHTCKRGGDILDFVKAKENLNLKEAAQFIIEKIAPVFLGDKIVPPQLNEQTEDLMDWREAAIASTKLEIALLEQLLEMKHVLLKQLLRDKQNTT